MIRGNYMRVLRNLRSALGRKAMNLRRAFALLGLAGIAMLTLVSCGRRNAAFTDDDGLLKYVPADTPYLYAALQPQPEDLIEKMGPWMESMVDSYRTLIEAAVSQVETAELSEAEQRKVRSVSEILAELITPEGRENAGFGRGTLGVLYGRGLLPVLRVALSDGARFEATIDRIATAMNDSLPVATLGTHSYRYFENDALRIVIAVDGDELVVTGVPNGLSDEHLAAVLNGELPSESIADSGKLEELAEAYEFTPHLMGLFDFDRLAATLLEPQSGTNAELLALVGYDPAAMLSDVCRSEFRDLANVSPRVVLGTTRLDAEEIAMKVVFELRSDIAAGLLPIATSLPGLGTLSEGLLSFGMGLDVAAARDFLAARLDALQADPFRCESLQDFQQGVPEARQALNTPLPPFVYGIKGLVAVVDEVRGLDNLAAGLPPTGFDLRLLLAADDAQGIVAMGAALSPDLAALDLQPDGTPVRMDVPPQIGPMVSEAYVALTRQAIAIAVGNDAESRLRSLVNAPAGPPLFLSTEMDARRYYGIVADMMAAGLQDDPGTPPEIREAMNGFLTPLANAPFERARGEVRFTEHGVEMLSTMTLGN
jgi:hypothetical protein